MSIYSKIIDQQKLMAAWKKVVGNKPACGVDHVTWDEFEKNSRMEIRRLNAELKNHIYTVQPVKLVTLVKDDKMREISLYTMRDKVIQTSIAAELERWFEAGFSRCAYAYRSDRSAMMAVEAIERYIVSHTESWVGRLDIDSFFDSIPQNILMGKLSAVIREQDVLELVRGQLRAPSLGSSGELVDKSVGLYQGSSLSPVLSNIYMTEFDRAMEKTSVFYIRYSDDILILGDSREEIHRMMEKMKKMLEELGLRPKESKTYSCSLEEGVDFLGYHFDHKGKAVPGKAREKLKQSMEDIWLMNPELNLEERLKKGSQILNGWEQYYKAQGKAQNIYEYVVLIYMVRGTDELEELVGQRENLVNTCRGIAVYLLSVWEEIGRQDLMLLEYEQYYGFGNKIRETDSRYLEEMLFLFEKNFINETAETWCSLMQAYSDLDMNGQAEKVMERIQTISEQLKEDSPIQLVGEGNAENTVEIGTGSGMTQFLMELFAGREDMYARESVTEEGKRHSEHVPEPLDGNVLIRHLSGEETIETYIARNNNTVHYLAVDVDVSRKVFLEENGDRFEAYLRSALIWAGRVKDILKQMGLEAYTEFSGFRGYHVWIFFSEWVPIRYAVSLAELIKGRMEDIPQEIQIEYFPAKTKKQQGCSGQKMKIPYGLHLNSGKRSYFCEKDGSPIAAPEKFLASVRKYTLQQLKMAVAGNISFMKENMAERKEILLDYQKLGDISDSVKQVLQGCALMRYLVNRAMTTGYLTHFERMSVLYVFGHLGEAGQEFVHTVMQFTMNYEYSVTQKFIGKLLSKPVSCIKLREQYKSVTAEYGCNCTFRRTKNCYPSPVIHALKNSTENETNITIPVSHTVSKERQRDIYQEINNPVRVQELAGKIVELKKQKRGIDRALEKAEKELSGIFDSAKTDCMDVDMGVLVRRKLENGYEWLIEI